MGDAKSCVTKSSESNQSVGNIGAAAIIVCLSEFLSTLGDCIDSNRAARAGCMYAAAKYHNLNVRGFSENASLAYYSW